MAFFDFLTRKAPAVRLAAPVDAITHLHRGRVASLEQTWYGMNRGYLNSPNTELRRELEKSRDLARLLASIDPYASKYLELLSIYTVGESGIQLDPQIMTPAGELDMEVNATIKAAWSDWCDVASYDERYSFKELEQLAIRTVGRDGEALFRIIRGKSVNTFGMALQPIDPTLLDTQYNTRLGDKGYVSMGVEYDGVRVVAYHIWNRYQDETAYSGLVGRERQRIPASEIIHIFDDPYGSLVRGSSWLTPALKTIARLHEYLDSHLLACQIASSAPLVMRTEGTNTVAYDDVSVSSTRDANGNTSTQAQDHAPMINLNYSQILELPANKRLEALNLQFPSNGFDIAVKTYLQSIAAALQVSYATLTSDSSAESYSTVKHGSVIERDHWRQVQYFFIQRFHRKVYRAWLDSAMLSGALTLPTIEPSDYYKVIFRSRGFKWNDPAKEMRAYTEGLGQGLFTRSQIVADMGGDWKENIITLADEAKFAQQHGFPLDTMADTLSIAQQVADLEATTTPMKEPS